MSDIYSKEGVLLLVQVDHLNGEVLGNTIDQLYQAGAHNVQCIPTVTKKNRPAHIFLVDLKEKNLDAVEAVILHEIGSTGWHQINSSHRHVRTMIDKKVVTIRVLDQSFEFQLEAKKTELPYNVVRPEYENCKQLIDQLELILDDSIPYQYVYQKIQSAWIDKVDVIDFNEA